jgi:uracil-DNA glycosylase family 4
MSYDPRACGARCDVCPLGPNGTYRTGPWSPVPPERHEGATVIAVAETPGVDDASFGRPLSGRSGGEWNLALLAVGRKRTDVDLTHVVACSAGAGTRTHGRSCTRLSTRRTGGVSHKRRP